MGAILPSFPSVPSYRFTVTLDGEQYRLRFRYHRRRPKDHRPRNRRCLQSRRPTGRRHHYRIAKA